MFIVKELALRVIPVAIMYLFLLYIRPGAKGDWNIIAIFVVGYIILEIFPASIVHYQYLKYNEDVAFCINTRDRKMSFENEGKAHSFHFDEIKSIHIALNLPLYKGGKRGASASNLYHYAVIEIESGEQFVVTCLLINQLRGFFKNLGLKETWDLQFFLPLIKMSRYKPKDPLGW